MASGTSSGARISQIAIKPEMKIKALADKDVTKIHQATLTVLEQTGVKFPSEKFLHIFAEAGAEVDLKTIDEIMAVGPDGHFLDRDFTVRNVRRLWQPRISHHWSPEMQNFRNPQEAALDKTKWILKNHKPEPLDENAANELKRIINTAENDLVKP